MKRRVIDSLLDILDETDKCAEIVARGEDEFLSSWILQKAADSLITNIGEASKRIYDTDPEFSQTFSDIDLEEMIAARNKYIHGYDAIEALLTWGTLAIDVPILNKDVKAILAKHLPSSSAWLQQKQ